MPEYTFVNDAGRTVPATKVKHNPDGSIGIFTVEGEGDQVVFVDNVQKGEGGGYYQVIYA